MKLCKFCNNEITGSGITFCSTKCRETYSNRRRAILNRKGNCEYCKKEISKNKFCSTECAKAFRSKFHLEQAELNDNSCSFKVYKRYLISMHGNKCMDCGWDKVNPTSNTVPIELEHIDGDHTNNKLENLKLLCPNCHSLTPTYKGLNRGKGRSKRMDRYKEGKSY